MRVLPVKDEQVVLERRGGAPQASVQAPDLRDAALDDARLSRKTYLSLREFAYRYSFDSYDAARMWLRRHADKVPTIHQGRRVLIMRRDAEEALQRRDDMPGLHLRKGA